MIKNFFKLFDYWSSDKKDKIFLFDEKTSMPITYRSFLKLVDKKKIDTYQKNKIIIFKLEKKLDSIVTFFAHLKMGHSVLILNSSDNDDEKKRWRHGWLKSTNKDLDAPKKFKFKDQCIWISSSGTTNRPVYWPHSTQSLLGTVSNHLNSVKIDNFLKVMIGFGPETIVFIRALFTIPVSNSSLTLEPFPSGLSLINSFKIFKEKDVNIIFMPPVYLDLFYLLGKKYNQKLPPCIKNIAISGDIVKPNSYKRFSSFFKFQPNIFYGLVEAGGPVSYMNGEGYYDFGIGNSLGCKITINNKGRVEIKSNSLSPAYLGTKIVTKDIGEYTHDMKIKIYGRSDSRVTLRGKRLLLAEIENQLYRVQGVEAVRVYKLSKDNDLKTAIVVEVVAKTETAKSGVKRFIDDNFPSVKIVFSKKIKIEKSGKLKRVVK